MNIADVLTDAEIEDLGDDIWTHPGLADSTHFPGADHDFALLQHEGTWLSYVAAPAGTFVERHPDEAAARAAYTWDLAKFVLGDDLERLEGRWAFDWAERGVRDTNDDRVIGAVPIGDQFGRVTWYSAWVWGPDMAGVDTHHDADRAREAACEAAERFANDLAISGDVLDEIRAAGLRSAMADSRADAAQVAYGDAIRAAWEAGAIDRSKGLDNSVTTWAERIGVSRETLYEIFRGNTWA